MNGSPLRRRLLWLLLFGLAGTTAELTLLEHYEDVRMVIPFVAVAAAVAGSVARLLRPSAATVRWLRVSMIPMLVAGAAGVYLHYLGGVEFQRDMDPTLSRWQMLWKVLHMQAPPMLAPGMLVQFALLGLASTFRDPLIHSSGADRATGGHP